MNGNKTVGDTVAVPRDKMTHANPILQLDDRPTVKRFLPHMSKKHGYFFRDWDVMLLLFYSCVLSFENIQVLSTNKRWI